MSMSAVAITVGTRSRYSVITGLDRTPCWQSVSQEVASTGLHVFGFGDRFTAAGEAGRLVNQTLCGAGTR